MQNAPPVTYPLGRSRVGILLTAVAWLAGLLSVLLWCAQPDISPWRQSVSSGIGIACTLVAIRGCMTMPMGHIAWTGQHWLWSSTGAQLYDSVEVCLDFQSWLLVRLRTGHDSVRWIWLERSLRPERWPELRRALHAPSRRTPGDTEADVGQTT